ncbi:type IV secretory system conjugative DNA transfer family protein [Phenylobacterium aquaticum]|uniref:type IV secretory system conjugative DNA transfer family protein n=1 Tax=Phenylobacterium aquaticum TaxID=1763816 RepID=UPI001F5DF9AC|nr:TraM recognition domain-containing protein [Phenylobacterium aquaticum]MCI3133146.1 type IV secretion system DNA-binding domain-containing protein [Phenylobacterium aquaticum]
MLPPEDHLTCLGETTFRRRFERFGIKQADRLSHLHVIGKTGVGKSAFLEGLARQDLAAGRGFALIDPHGDLVGRMAAAVPETMQSRIRYLNAPDPAQPYGYNPLRRVRADKIPLAASGLMETLKKLWPDAWGIRMEHVLRNSLYLLMERDGSILPDLLRLYADADFRKNLANRVRNGVVRAFWKDEFARYPDRYRLEVVAPIQNKLGALLADPTLHRILVPEQVDLHFRSLMDEGGVLLANLAKGRLGEDSAATVGGLLVSTIGLAALSRADQQGSLRRPFHLYVDEFQSFTTLSFANLLSELRKYGLGVTLAHQHLHQLEPDIRHAVLGNVGTLVAFRVGAEDAPLLAREFAPAFGEQDLMNLPNRRFYLKLMIDGTPSRPFSGQTLPLAS